MGLFGSTKVKIKQAPLLSPTQRMVESKIGSYILSNLGTQISGYPGKLVPDIPESLSSLYSNLLGGEYNRFGDISRAALLQDVAAIPAWQWNESNTKNLWEKSFAIPAMETYRKTIEPMLSKQFAGVPGGFYSSDKQKGMETAASDYYGKYVMPTLFQSYQSDIERGFSSAEAAAARRMPAVEMLTGLPFREFSGLAGAYDVMRAYEAEKLKSDYEEWLKKQPYGSPWMQLGLQYLGIPTSENIAYQKQPSIFQNLLGIGAGSGVLGAISGILQGGGLSGALSGAGNALNSLFSLSDARLKSNITQIDNAIEKVSNLNGCTYEIGDEHRAGLIAQDVEKVLPEAVKEIRNAKCVDYGAVVGLLVEAVKELTEQIKEIKDGNSSTNISE